MRHWPPPRAAREVHVAANRRAKVRACRARASVKVRAKARGAVRAGKATGQRAREMQQPAKRHRVLLMERGRAATVAVARARAAMPCRAMS